MRKMLMAAVLLVGCAGDPDPTKEVMCDAAWGGAPTCAAACEVVPVLDRPACTADLDLGFTIRSHPCGATFEWNGARGCCWETTADPVSSHVVFFAECLP